MDCLVPANMMELGTFSVNHRKRFICICALFIFHLVLHILLHEYLSFLDVVTNDNEFSLMHLGHSFT